MTHFFAHPLTRSVRYLCLGVLLLTGASAQNPLLRSAIDLGNGWYNQPWFGNIYTPDSTRPWVYDTKLGWLYVTRGAGDDFWLYSTQAKSWLYTHSNIYPYAYDHRNGWVYFSLSGSQTWFYAYDTLDWVNLQAPPMGKPYDKQVALSRFLDQATLGTNLSTLQAATSTGIKPWIEAQLQLPYAPIFNEALQVQEQHGGEIEAAEFFHALWWKNVMTQPDLLRQRVVLALSEIIVVSDQPDLLTDNGAAMASWYDMLLQHAFGNFRDLLYDVTLHPVMGSYLSHAGNRKADPSIGRYPDENYAREIMQLFTIGLYELNQDGSRKLDANGQPIPTYGNAEISAFARVFTGLNYDWQDLIEEGLYDPNTQADQLFQMIINFEVTNFFTPMRTHETEHDTGEKTLLKGTVLPADQTTLQDINGAIDNLFHHPNVGPFIGHLLIQRLVKSNPSPGYISRVAVAFNDNGQGVRGDMKAVIRAIYYDQEARNLYHMEDPAHGKMREPFVRFVKLMRAMNAADKSKSYWRSDLELQEDFGQRPFSSPSVFNFFLPDFQPQGPLSDQGLVAPEFQITNSQTIPSYFNQFQGAVFVGMGDPSEFTPPTEDEGEPISQPIQRLFYNPWFFDTSDLMPLVDNPSALVDRLDLLLTNGAMEATTKATIVNAISGIPAENLDPAFSRLSLAIYLTTISPDYAISR